MIFQSLYLGFLPLLLDAVGGLVSTLRSSIALRSPSHGGQSIHFRGKNEETEAPKSNHAVVLDKDSNPPLDLWHLWTVDLLDTSHVHVDLLVSPCACTVAASAPGPQRSRTKLRRRKGSVVLGGGSGSGSGRGDGGSFRRLVARHEHHLTCAAVVAALQVFLHLTGANATTLFLPLLSQAMGSGGGAARVGDAVLVLLSTCGVVGSALAAREIGREAMCAIGGVLVVLCQVAAAPAAMAGGLGGGARMAGGHAAGTFAAACAVSGGFGWAWGALFWAVPGDGIRSVGQAAGAALGFGLGFAQMQCFLLTLRQLKHAAFAYYAVWIWS